MRIIPASHEIITPMDGEAILKTIERIGRLCYKSEDKITEDSARQFVKMLLHRGHESVLEHVSFSVRFIVDRGVSHEIVRHRLASYSQESTRYCNYGKDGFGGEITVIEPCFLEPKTQAWKHWYNACAAGEVEYFNLLDDGYRPEEARSVLPNSLKTEMIMTANIREWRHFLMLRCSPLAHPQMRDVTIPLLKELRGKIPVLFDDL